MGAAWDYGSTIYPNCTGDIVSSGGGAGSWADGVDYDGLFLTAVPNTELYIDRGWPMRNLFPLDQTVTLRAIDAAVSLPNLAATLGSLTAIVGFTAISATLMDVTALPSAFTAQPTPLLVGASLPSIIAVPGSIPIRVGNIIVQVDLQPITAAPSLASRLAPLILVVTPMDPVGEIPYVPPPLPYTVIPITPILTGVYATSRTWGGQIIARPDPDNLRTDLLEIYAYGFNILGVDYMAGEAHVWVVGDFALADRWTNNFDTHRRDTPGWFYLLPAGELVTLSLVKRWTPRRQFLF